ncbi:SseB family protein [Microbacterium aoyamense]|uniref:SseB family protein n=1 Tax=Microbacterium aoyamense TaxID=344166 RepID=A0ABN2PY63_9MICO|nr:SseB family protein [Microbacterium aoyamense]
MSQGTDPAHDHRADSAGVPWEGRSFHENPNAGDDGSADPALLAALTAFRGGEGDQVAVVDAYRAARLLIPLVAEKGDHGIGAHGLDVDKTQELSIVTVAAPDGRRVLPVFTSVDAMKAWDAAARPVPADGVRTAVAAADDDTDLIVIDPGSETEFVLRRPAVWAIAQGRTWEPSHTAPDVFRGLQESIGGELAVLDLAVAAGDPDARLRGPELVVRLHLIDGLDQAELDAVLQRLARRWAADDRIAVLVDSLSVKLVRG